jgi:hypothetical protein
MLFVVNCLFVLFSALRAARRTVSTRTPHGAIAIKIGKSRGFDNKKISVIAVLQPVDASLVAFQRYFQMKIEQPAGGVLGAFPVIFGRRDFLPWRWI